MELIGTGSFNEKDPDWPCDEVWEPAIRGTNIPANFSGDHWESPLEKMKALVLNQIKSNSSKALKLEAFNGLGIGFVDGDLDVIWRP